MTSTREEGMSNATLLVHRYELAAQLSERVSKAALTLLREHLDLSATGGRPDAVSVDARTLVVRTVERIAGTLEHPGLLTDPEALLDREVRTEVVQELSQWFLEARSTADRMGGGEEVRALAAQLRRPESEWSSEVLDELTRFATSLDAYVASLYAQLPTPRDRRNQDG